MIDLVDAGNDADRTFWYDPVAEPVRSCSSDPPPTKLSSQKLHWIEIALVDENGHPVKGEAYKIRLPNGKIVTGNLDSRGLARVDGIDPGTCKVTFPELDKRTWNRSGAGHVG